MTTYTGLIADSHAVLVGVSAYEYAEFPPIRAARNSLYSMQALLADPALCGWPPELITMIANPISAADVADRIADLAETTTGVLLLYYVGHGVLSMRGELCLTVTSTRRNRPEITGLSWGTLADVLRTCPARTRLAILDCCFAGRAIEAMGADADQALADITNVDGVYTLTATTRNRTAHVPPPDQQDTACTSFTSELQALIRSGIPGKPAQLTFSDIYPELRQRLRAKGLPDPSQRGVDNALQFPFAANTAARTVPAARTTTRLQAAGNGRGEATPGNAAPVRTTRPRQTRIVNDALRAARLVSDEDKRALALTSIARTMAVADPDRAERIAQSVTNEYHRAQALACVAEAIAPADPDRAERIAQSVTNEYHRAQALACVAEAIAPADPDRADRLADDAEEAVMSVSEAPWSDDRTQALVRVAEAIAPAKPDRAERIAQSVSGSYWADDEPHPLACIAEAMAAADPDRAERIAQSIRNGYWKVLALASIVRTVAAADPDRARQLVDNALDTTWSVYDQNRKDFALLSIARTIAVADPDRAERIAQSISDDYWKAQALAHIARTVAAVDPDRAHQLAGDAEEAAQSVSNHCWKAQALAHIARTVAAVDPDRAHQLAADAEEAAQSITRSVTDEYEKASTLASIARTMAVVDPDRAERIADAAEKAAQVVADKYKKAQALADVAGCLLTAQRASTSLR